MPDTLLIVDDEESICKNLGKYFRGKGFDILMASDGESAIELCQTKPVGLVLLDIGLPGMSGLDVLKRIKTTLPNVGVIMITAYGDAETAVRAMKMKADDYILKPIDMTGLGIMVNNVLETYRTQSEVSDIKQQVSTLDSSVRLKETYNMIKALAGAIEAKDPFTKGHSYRVSQLSVEIGKRLGFNDEELEILEYGALLHDIGKIGVKEVILNKPGRLSAKEYAHIQRHPVIGEDIVKPVEIFHPVLTLIRSHHEHFDGRGYPDGLKGEKINIFARIVSVPDSFDAMTSDRPYREALSVNEALSRIDEAKGTQFDPQIVDIFIGGAIKIYDRYIM
ncbi:MAG: response regulator [Deltaproteobacteria bacterium]|nr:MAG: response regulator [Deltaproteobacteria bacterium]